MITASAPGKIMILGEHAVVHGYACLVIAISQKITIAIKSGSYDSEYLLPDGVSPSYVEACIVYAKKYWHVTLKEHTLISQSTLSESGLGSSAATCVAALAALAQLANKKIDKPELFSVARQVALHVQGNGSGFDIAAAVFGGTVLYARGGSVCDQVKHPALPLFVYATGEKANTGSLIASVIQKRKDNPALEEVFKKMGELTLEGTVALTRGDWPKLGSAMNQAQQHLQTLGVSTPIINDFTQQAIRLGAYGAKLSGAGGGDCVIVVADDSHQTKLDLVAGKLGMRRVHI